MLLLIYVIVCLLVAFLAQRRGHSLLLYFLLSIVLTPVITTLLLVFLIPSRPRALHGSYDAGTYAGDHVTCGRCRHLARQVKTHEYCAHCGGLL